MGKTRLDETYIFQISIKLQFFWCRLTIGIKIRFFIVSVTIEQGRSLLQFVTTNCLKSHVTFDFPIPKEIKFRVYE